MGELIKFQTKKEKTIFERMSISFHVQTDILEDGSLWYKLGTQNSWEDSVTWDDWKRIEE